jgi:TonB family protein
MAKRRGQHGWHWLPAVLVAAVGVHASGIWLGDAWMIWKIKPPEEQAQVIDLSDYEIEEVVFLEEVPPEDPVKPQEELEDPEQDTKPEDSKKELEKVKLAEKKPKKLEAPDRPDPLKPPPPPPKPKIQPPPPPKLAEVKPVPKPPPPPPPPPPEVVAKPKAPKKKPPPIERKKMVEVKDDKSVIDEPPPDVNYYSDKNRRPAKEEYAKDRNLEKTQKGDKVASTKSDDKTSEEIGGEEDKVRQVDEVEETTLDDQEKKKVASVSGGKSDHAEGVRSGDLGQKGEEGRGGEGGQGGQGGTGGQSGTAGKLSMREAKGLGVTPGGPTPSPAGVNDDAPEVAMTKDPGGKAGAPGRAGEAGRLGKPGKKGPKLRIDSQDYTRIVGNDKVEEEVALHNKKKGAKKGKWDKKLAKIQSTLETFTGEVKPGNQTALGTRAHPFAVYIARMHNRIHEVWGFGFLADLDGKPQSNPMNNRQLAVTMEIVVAADGEVDRVTIVRPSGVLTFDVAAVDTVMSLGPYEETPSDIRSGDGKVYIHWTFHRDERMCTPYFADPFILDNEAPNADSAHAEAGHSHGEEPGRAPPSRLGRPQPGVEKGKAGQVQVPVVKSGQVTTDAASDAQVKAKLASPDDPRATDVALAWANAFEKDDLAALMAISTAPFHSRGQVVAQSDGQLASVWRVVLNESESKRVKEWKVLSPAGYRAAYGHLPEGAEDGSYSLYLVAKVGKERLTLELTQMTDGSFRITGLTR